jgi:hypothetical protein
MLLFPLIIISLLLLSSAWSLLHTKSHRTATRLIFSASNHLLQHKPFVTNNFTTKTTAITRTTSTSIPLYASASSDDDEDDDEQQMNEIDNDVVIKTKVVANDASDVEGQVQGYRSGDIGELGGDKKTRVGLYIGLALVPVLTLVPFMMSRSFVPPIDPAAMLP